MLTYSGVGTLLRQSDPLPPFYQARSMFVLEEASLTKKAASSTSSSAFVAGFNKNSSSASPTSNRGPHNPSKKTQRKNSGGRNSGQRTGGSDHPPTVAVADLAVSLLQQQQQQLLRGLLHGLIRMVHGHMVGPCFLVLFLQLVGLGPTTWQGSNILGQGFYVPGHKLMWRIRLLPCQDIDAAMHTLGLTPPDPNCI